VPQTREYMVNLCSYRQVEKTGTRTRMVCETVQQQVPVTQSYCVSVPYQVTVRVPVYVPCAAPAAPPCP
jgi:hypothetical protein